MKFTLRLMITYLKMDLDCYSLCTKEEGTSFNFCHFTTQEFLAAYYISTLPIEQQPVYMNNIFWIDRFAYMWVMYVGIFGV